MCESNTHEVDPEGVKLYLDYLDKEMNIMGILSAFCVATVAFTLRELLEAEPNRPLEQIWEYSGWFVIIGSALILGAAAWFYRQRSDLAWYYGQISLTRAASEVTKTELFDWLKDADSWTTWISYRCGFFLLWPGLVAYMAAAVSYNWGCFAHATALGIYVSMVLVLLWACWRTACILAAHPYDENPLTLKSLFGKEEKV
jgi:hypothetical protein